MGRRSFATFVALAMALTVIGTGALAQEDEDGRGPKSRALERAGGRAIGDGVIDSPVEADAHHKEQHGPRTGHIPGSSRNVDLIGQVTVADAVEGRISDVWSHGNHAYLGTFVFPDCTSSGIYVIDISNPRTPQEVGFISQDGFVDDADGSRPQDVKVFHMDTPLFTGDVLIHTNEPCSALAEPGPGGVTLWDVTDPTNPQFLGHGGDFDLAEFFFGHANGVHNVFPWQDGNRAFAALVDDWELEDVDILEITDPTNPVLIAETGLGDWPDATVNGNGQSVFNHDVWVMEVEGRHELLSSYWDAGFVRLDVSNPANPVFIADSDYPDPDPLTGFSPPEGNGHAAVWSADGRFILGGDEDFSPSRIDPFEITTGPNAGEFPAGEFGWTLPILGNFPGDQVNGPTIYGGSGCPGADLDEDGTDDREQVPEASTLSVASGEERVVVFTRGTCFFSDKVRSGEEKGYDVVLIGNHHNGAAGGAFPDAAICGGQGSPVLGTAAGICIGHRAMHLIFNDDVEFEPATGATSPDMPPTGTEGEKVLAVGAFDGWGYLHLLDADTLEEVDAHAPPEVLDPRFAQGFGDLTMHNVETDPQGQDLAYISWYSLGLRVVRFGSDGLEEVGHYVDEDGNNFWGVHVHVRPNGEKLILTSDRDTGLWIFRFNETGACDINGTPDNDVLVGTSRSETICAGPGDDHLRAAEGADILRAGAGADLAVGGPGADLIFGGPGPDNVRGGGGNDTVHGGGGNDLVVGGPGNDVCTGGPGRNDVFKGCETERA